MRQKQITFKVKIKLSEHINSEEEITTLANNILEALVHESETKGLAPDSTDGFTESINISYGNWHWKHIF